jgi:hypothetical protein
MLLKSILIASLTFGSVYLIGVTGPIVSTLYFNGNIDPYNLSINMLKGVTITIYAGANCVFLYCVYKAITM